MKVNSEIGRLRKVLVHRPGQEMENMAPSYFEQFLFDDVPFLKRAQKEHDIFVAIMEKEGVEVVYLIDLITQTLVAKPHLQNQFIEEFIKEGLADNHQLHSHPQLPKILKTYFQQWPLKKMIAKMIAGVRDFEVKSIIDLSATFKKPCPFLLFPLPNLTFQRDPFSVIGNGVSISNFHFSIRRRETIFAKYIFQYHPDYNHQTPIWYHPDQPYHLEGGDQLVINKQALFVGISERSQQEAIDILAQQLLTNRQNQFQTIIGFNLIKKRQFMHLDTVFTQVDYNKFVIYPAAITKEFSLFKWEIIQGKLVKNQLKINSLPKLLAQITGQKEIILIKCGGDDVLAAEREQWNDGTNTLCLSPGKVLVYDRNHITNHLLQKAGVTTLIMPSSEISRGRGGPRCMSMPLVRDEIEGEKNET